MEGAEGLDVGHGAARLAPDLRGQPRSDPEVGRRRWRRRAAIATGAPEAMPMPISRKRRFRMLARWPGESIQARTIARGVASVAGAPGDVLAQRPAVAPRGSASP